MTVVMWAHCSLCVPQLQPQLEDARNDRDARVKMKAFSLGKEKELFSWSLGPDAVG